MFVLFFNKSTGKGVFTVFIDDQNIIFSNEQSKKHITLMFYEIKIARRIQ